MKRGLWAVVLMSALLIGCQNKPYEAPQLFASVTGLLETEIGHITVAHDKYRGVVVASSPADLQALYTAIDSVQYAKARKQPTEPPGPGGLDIRIVSTVNKVVTVSSSDDGHLRIDEVDYYTVTGDSNPQVVDSGLGQPFFAVADLLYQQMSAVPIMKGTPAPVFPDVPEVKITVSNQGKPLATLKPGDTVKIPTVNNGSSYEVEIIFPKAFDIKGIGKTTITSEIWHFGMNSGAMDRPTPMAGIGSGFTWCHIRALRVKPRKTNRWQCPSQSASKGSRTKQGTPSS